MSIARDAGTRVDVEKGALVRTRANRSLGGVLALAVAMIALHAERASADSVGISGFLEGQPLFAHILDELTLSFPDFTVALSDVTRLSPGFCLECGTGALVPFTQSTGSFSGHSVANTALNTIDADISGNLSFTGPTDTLNISPDPFLGDILSEPVQWSGSLTITQANQVLFNGTVGGSGVALVDYETGPIGDLRLGGYQFEFNGLGDTPEPASIILLGSGLAWLAVRRRTLERRR
jgi:hypothetical protein